MRESDAKDGVPRGRLWHTGLVFRRSADDSRMRAIPNEMKRGVRCAIRIEGHIAGRRPGIRRLHSERYGMRQGWVFIRPLHRVSCVNLDRPIEKTHDGQ